MTITVTESIFRTDFPEFTDTTIYPTSSVNFWLSYAVLLLNAQRWSTVVNLGAELYIAHNLVLEAKAQAEAANGAPPGVTTGPIAGKSVDKVSINYDVNAGIVPDAGHWNLTIYGTRFIQMSRMFGAGPILVNFNQGTNPLNSDTAWSGPFTQSNWDV